MSFALQTLQDAYAGAQSASEAKEAWVKKRERLLEGTVGRQAGGGEEAHMPYVRRIVRSALGDANKAKYDAIPSDDQKARSAFLNGLFGKLDKANREAIDAAALDAYQTDFAAKQATEKAVGGLAI